jgi:hypothetical protein
MAKDRHHVAAKVSHVCQFDEHETLLKKISSIQIAYLKKDTKRIF